jgi:hypothetical protein
MRASSEALSRFPSEMWRIDVVVVVPVAAVAAEVGDDNDDDAVAAVVVVFGIGEGAEFENEDEETPFVAEFVATPAEDDDEEEDGSILFFLV